MEITACLAFVRTLQAQKVLQTGMSRGGQYDPRTRTLGEFALAMFFRFEGGRYPWKVLCRQVAKVSTWVLVGTPGSHVSGV